MTLTFIDKGYETKWIDLAGQTELEVDSIGHLLFSKTLSFKSRIYVETYLVKMSFSRRRIEKHFLSMVSHFASFWNRGLVQMEIGLSYQFPFG